MTKRGSRYLVILLLLFVFIMPLWLSGNDYWFSVFSLVAINTLLVYSLRCLILIDQVSLGQVGFAIIGAYCSAILAMKAGMPFWFCLLASGMLSALIALILGYPFLKVKGIYFSILTLLTAETFRLVAYYWTGLTGGTQGLIGIPAPAPIDFPFIGKVDFGAIQNYYYIVAAVVSISIWILYLIERSHINFKWRAIKDADELAGSVGINVIGFQITNFTIAAFFAGISGSLFAHFQHNLSADYTSRFSVTMSIYLLVFLVVGGQKNFFGPIIGTLLLSLFTEFARPLQSYQPIFTGALAIFVMLFMPYGVAGLPVQIYGRIKRRFPSPAP
jgi:branched-chain amino acid transport system permease protein